MYPDKDRILTWKKYNADFCTSCLGHCCSMPVEVKAKDLIRLEITNEDEIQNSIKKTAKRLKKEGYISSYREGTEFFMLTQKANSDCFFLDSRSRLCTVYDKRPDTCRDFPSRVGPKIGFCPSEKK
jgi:Fe-S-cluster containining protein